MRGVTVNLRKLLVSAVVLVALFNGAAAAGNVSFGFKAGLNVTSITDNPPSWDPELSYKAGIGAGFFLIYRFNNSLSLQPELLYSQRGVQTTLLDYDVVSIDMTAEFDYVELPLLLVYRVPLKGSFRPILYAGPVLSYLLSSELAFSASILSVSVDFSSVTHVNDFGGIVGTGFEWEVGDGIITFDIRYQLGFTNVIVGGDFDLNGSPETIEGDDIKNQGFAFLIGYVF